MIIKGGRAGNVGFWSQHLQREDTNERAEVMEISGLLAADLPTALREMEAIGAQSRSRGNFLYQANLNPEAHEHLTPEQWNEAVDILEKKLGFEGHQRVVVEHEKHGRTHRHVIWNRVDVETLKVADITGNYRQHIEAARDLEQRFDLSPTPSPQRLQPQQEQTADKPDRAPELWEIRAAERSGIDREQVKQDVTEAWRTTDSGKAFAAAIEERGYILARGDRRDFCIVDSAGDAHSLARRIEGAKVQDVRERMADIDPASLPSVADARAVMREARAAHVAEQQQRERPLTKIEACVAEELGLAESPAALNAALYREGITIARADAAGREQVQRDYDARYHEQRIAAHGDDRANADDIKRREVQFVDGEIVALDRFANVHRINPHHIDPTKLEAALTHGTHGLPNLSGVRDFIKQDRAAEQKQNAAARDARTSERIENRGTKEAKAHADWQERAADQRARRSENQVDRTKVAAKDAIRNAIENPTQTAKAAALGALDTGLGAVPVAKEGLRVTNAATGVVSSLGSFVDSLLGGKRPQPTEETERFRAQRRALAAMENIRESMERGENLSASDVSALPTNHLQNIKARGDDYIREIIEKVERDRERGRDYGRSRER